MEKSVNLWMIIVLKLSHNEMLMRQCLKVKPSSIFYLGRNVEGRTTSDG